MDAIEMPPQALAALAQIADSAERVRCLLEAQEHVLEAVQARNSVDMRPASSLNNAISDALREVAESVGELRSSAERIEQIGK